MTWRNVCVATCREESGELHSRQQENEFPFWCECEQARAGECGDLNGVLRKGISGEKGVGDTAGSAGCYECNRHSPNTRDRQYTGVTVPHWQPFCRLPPGPASRRRRTVARHSESESVQLRTNRFSGPAGWGTAVEVQPPD
eukprot:2078380-Rhodomonas_salina.10